MDIILEKEDITFEYGIRIINYICSNTIEHDNFIIKPDINLLIDNTFFFLGSKRLENNQIVLIFKGLPGKINQQVKGTILGQIIELKDKVQL